MREFKVGQRAWSALTGWGEVKDYPNSTYPIIHNGTTYTIDGKIYTENQRPTLFHNEIPESEWPNPEPPPEPLPELDVDAKIWVRDFKNSEWAPRHFAKWGEHGGVLVWLNGQTSFTSRDEKFHFRFWKLEDGRTNCPTS